MSGALDYSVNMGKWNSVFAVPTCSVDYHMKLAGAAQLKVLRHVLSCRTAELGGHADACPECGEVIDLSNLPTSIHSVTADDDTNWWTLQGYKIGKRPLQPGVYIHNGRKVVVKAPYANPQ